MTSTASPAAMTLITGASAGIGAALAREFAAHGHGLVLVARSQDKLEALAAEIRQQQGVPVETCALDLASPQAPEALQQTLQTRGIRINTLVNNAGVLVSGPFAKASLGAHRQLLQLNIDTLTTLTHLFLQDMLAQGNGHILNVASTSAFQPVPTLSTYAASKAYVLSFSEALAAELHRTGVTVTALCPGFTETDMIIKEDGGAMRLGMLRNMTAAEVAAQGYQACMKGSPVYVNGWGNRTAALFSGLLPRWLQRMVNRRLARQGF